MCYQGAYHSAPPSCKNRNKGPELEKQLINWQDSLPWCCPVECRPPEPPGMFRVWPRLQCLLGCRHTHGEWGELDTHPRVSFSQCSCAHGFLDCEREGGAGGRVVPVLFPSRLSAQWLLQTLSNTAGSDLNTPPTPVRARSVASDSVPPHGL